MLCLPQFASQADANLVLKAIFSRMFDITCNSSPLATTMMYAQSCTDIFGFIQGALSNIKQFQPFEEAILNLLPNRIPKSCHRELLSTIFLFLKICTDELVSNTLIIQWTEFYSIRCREEVLLNSGYEGLEGYYATFMTAAEKRIHTATPNEVGNWILILCGFYLTWPQGDVLGTHIICG